jgi:LemA protein
MMQVTTIILIVLAIMVLWLIALYNRFVRLITRAREAWADIDVQLKRRYDLIPNLVNTVKGYASHESSAFENVTKARAMAMGAEGLSQKAGAENMLTGALKSLFAVAEAYPDLKANQNFLELQRELSDTENKIQAARRFYNSNVRDLNIATKVFPSSIIARSFNFKAMEFFDLEGSESERQAVKVDFNK